MRSRQGWRLLALLALRRGRTVDRSFLAGTLWPESREEDAIANLRRELGEGQPAVGKIRIRTNGYAADLRQRRYACWSLSGSACIRTEASRFLF